MITALDEAGIDLVHRLVSKTYDTGDIPEDMLKSVFVTLPKKPNTLDCDQHRTISLMSHTLKLLLKIILERCRSKFRPEIPQQQYGFMPDRGTRNVIFVMRMLSGCCIQHQQTLYVCFIDYKKAFDKVRHERLLEMLRNIGIDDKDYRIIKNLYYLQQAAVRIPGGLTEWTEIKRGVRQGCGMSPDLFNLYSESILRPLDSIDRGISVNGVTINNIR